jgi:hypothetical protein
MSFAAVLPLFLLLPSAKAAEPTDWFHDAKWGVMTHYLGAPPSSNGGAELTAEAWNKQVDGFDVNAFVDQLASTRAKYLLFTIGQNSGHYCAPNATYDRIVGINPSKCSRRDLIADLAKALSARNIRLMVYLPSGAPAADPVARKALGWRWGAKGDWQLPGEPVGGRLVEFQRNWEAVIREWSLRWGKSVSGWWIDGCYFADQMYRFDDEPNFASFARALKAGNPESIVAFNPGVKVPVICHTKYDDYTAGEVNLPELSKAVETCPGRWLKCEGRKVQFHILSFLGKTWCSGDRPQLPDERIVAYTRQVTDKGGVITYDVPIQKSGLIPEPFVEQLRSIGQSQRETSQTQKEVSPSLHTASSEDCFLFSYFVGNGEDGLHLARSSDGYHWEALNGGKSFLAPQAGKSRLMRDPCLLRAPDGTFQLVWTNGWNDQTIGYASSKDLLHWSEQRAIAFMAHEPQAMNCWAPEVVYDEAKQQYVIFWSTTIPGRFPQTDGTGDGKYNHRIYSTTTKDFKTFTSTRLFFDGGFNVIDATMLRAEGKCYLIVKDETLKPVKKNLRIAVGTSPEGPFGDVSAPFTSNWVEGPSAMRIGDDYVVYFDYYTKGHYGAVRSRNLKDWKDVTSRLLFPKGARHGTVLQVPKSVVDKVSETR